MIQSIEPNISDLFN